MEQSSQATSAAGAGFADPSPATGPFVVNLCTSLAPIELKSVSLPGLERYRVYQVRRVEDNRPRYRLRLGFFADETATEAVLHAVRELYPAAFTVAAGSDDLKHAPEFDANTLGSHSSGTAKGTATTGTHQRIAPAVKPAKQSVMPTAAAPANKPAPAVPPQEPAPVLQLLPDIAPPAPKAAVVESITPFRVKATDPALLARTSGLELQTDSKTTVRKSPIVAPLMMTDGPILIDSTQTLRMLTEAELSDAEGPQWFVVQLAVSEQAINLDTMPKLDIFSAFRLYSIAMPQQGKILHSMRLGFFREAVSAEAVAGYLKTFFSAPNVMRVSSAEQTRFADPPARPVLETTSSSGKVVALNEARHRSSKPAAPVLSNAVGQTAQQPVVTSPVAPSSGGQSQPVKPKPKPAAANKAATRASATAVARKTSAPVGKRPAARNRSLNELLHEEARQVVLSESGVRCMEQKGSLLSRLVGKLTR